MLLSWQFSAIMSAIFAALTAVFAKVGIENINSDFATFIRTISTKTRLCLVLSGLATGASWLCYFRALKLGDAARVAPIDKMSVVLVACRG